MDRHREVLQQVNRLESLIPDGLFGSDDWDFKAIWQQIRRTGKSFKGVRFPSREEHEEAWNRFQNLVEKVKDKQREKRRKFERRKEASEKLRDHLIHRAELALPDSGLGDVVLAIVTGGLSVLVETTLDALLGPFDKRKEELLGSNRALKAVWQEFSSRKGELSRDDKQTVYHVLKEKQSQLDDLWREYKAERQKTKDAYFKEKRRRHDEWRSRVLANIAKNQERKSRLEGVLAHKRSHLGDLHGRLADAWSDEFRSRVLGWIAEEEAAISDIGRKIDDINGWIQEDLAKLDG